MKFGMHLEYILICCFFTGTQCTTVERYYKSSQNKTSAPNTGNQITTSKRSRIECAVACREDADCSSFSYDRKSKTCRMSKGIMQTISDRVYCATDYIGCPSELGYGLRTYSDTTLCLKFVTLAADHAGAVAGCAADNAHLVMFDGDSTRRLIVDMLTELGAGTGSMDYVYVDGYDYGNQDIFRTWKGDDIWTLWSPGLNPQHDTREDCIVGKLYTNFRTIDWYCDSSYPYICQLDVI